MAPEEFTFGALIDERTTVFTPGRLVWHFGTRLTEQAGHFCGTDGVAAVVRRACRPDPAGRYASVREFAAAWWHTRR